MKTIHGLVTMKVATDGRCSWRCPNGAKCHPTWRRAYLGGGGRFRPSTRRLRTAACVRAEHALSTLLTKVNTEGYDEGYDEGKEDGKVVVRKTRHYSRRRAPRRWTRKQRAAYNKRKREKKRRPGKDWVWAHPKTPKGHAQAPKKWIYKPRRRPR